MSKTRSPIRWGVVCALMVGPVWAQTSSNWTDEAPANDWDDFENWSDGVPHCSGPGVHATHLNSQSDARVNVDGQCCESFTGNAEAVQYRYLIVGAAHDLTSDSDFIGTTQFGQQATS